MSGEKEWYNLKYRQANYFGLRQRVFRPYVRSLLAYIGLKPGSTLLDLGCGQGFFSSLFHQQGLNVCGLDLSETGIRSARQACAARGIAFMVANAHNLPFLNSFDCIFTRACSLYNQKDFPFLGAITDELISYLNDGGVFVFAYNTRFDSSVRSDTWTYHTLSDFDAHFARYPQAEKFVVNRLDMQLMGKWAFNPFVTRLNVALSRRFGFGVEFICIVRSRINGSEAPTTKGKQSQ